MDRQQFISDALSLLGTPYQHQGRNSSAVDCIGLATVCFEKQDYVCDYPKAYKRISTTDEIYKFLDSKLSQTTVKQPGNIIIFKKRKVYFHLGILLKDSKIVHSINKQGSHQGCVKVSSLIEEKEWLNYDYIIYDIESIL